MYIYVYIYVYIYTFIHTRVYKPMYLEGHPDKMWNMKCWLKKYNLLDVQPLAVAIERSFDCFHQYFGEDANIHQSLPAVAQASLYRHYDQSCAYTYSFQESEDEIRRLHRSSICGGLVNVFHRSIYLGVSFTCVYIHVYIRIYTCIYTYIYTCIYTYTYLYILG